MERATKKLKVSNTKYIPKQIDKIVNSFTKNETKMQEKVNLTKYNKQIKNLRKYFNTKFNEDVNEIK